MKILVIGADRGLGNILYKMLEQRGHTVAAGFYSLDSADKDSRGLTLSMDVTDEKQMKENAKRIEDEMGKLDAVIDVAGILLPSDRSCTLMDEPVEDVIRQMNTNAVGVLIAFRTIFPIMNKGSRFFAVTSEGGSFTLAGTLYPAYSVSKTAANKFVQVLRLTVNSEDVDLLAVHPGRMNTQMGRDTAQIEPQEAAEGFCKLIEGLIPVDSRKHWFINYKGEPMQV